MYLNSSVGPVSSPWDRREPVPHNKGIGDSQKKELEPSDPKKGDRPRPHLQRAKMQQKNSNMIISQEGTPINRWRGCRLLISYIECTEGISVDRRYRFLYNLTYEKK